MLAREVPASRERERHPGEARAVVHPPLVVLGAPSSTGRSSLRVRGRGLSFAVYLGSDDPCGPFIGKKWRVVRRAGARIPTRFAVEFSSRDQTRMTPRFAASDPFRAKVGAMRVSVRAWVSRSRGDEIEPTPGGVSPYSGSFSLRASTPSLSNSIPAASASAFLAAT